MSSPIPIVSFSAKAGEKIATKTYKKTEKKTAVRAGVQVSKSYVIQKIRQPIMTFGTTNNTDEIGYVIQRKEVGDTVGPFWTWYPQSGFGEEKVARQEADAAVDELIQATANELVG